MGKISLSTSNRADYKSHILRAKICEIFFTYVIFKKCDFVKNKTTKKPQYSKPLAFLHPVESLPVSHKSSLIIAATIYYKFSTKLVIKLRYYNI